MLLLFHDLLVGFFLYSNRYVFKINSYHNTVTDRRWKIWSR